MTRRRRELTVGAEDCNPNLIVVPAQLSHTLSRSRIPHPRSAICAAGDNKLAIGAVGHPEDIVGVPLEGEEFLAGLRIPPSPCYQKNRWPGACRLG